MTAVSTLREWAYARSYQNSDERQQQIEPWLHNYSLHRPHPSLKLNPPASRSGLNRNNLLSLHISHWFDTSAFSAPAPFQFGNTPREFGNLRSDWIRNIDLSLQKDVKATERMSVEIRGDAFNMDNTPTFAPPNTAFGSSQFGVVSAQQNAPRSIQLGVKVIY